MTTPKTPEISSGEEALEMLRTDFALYCRMLRINLGLSQGSFGLLMGIKPPQQAKITVCRWEAGNHTPQRRYLEKFLTLQKRFDSNKSRKRE